jgi:hypothetical protein
MATGDQAIVDPEKFKQTRWLDAVCQPDPSARVMGTQQKLEALLQNDPNAFFAPPYARPYEDWCVEDHQAAKQMDARYKEEARNISWQSWQAAWAWCPHPEFCALVSDDVQTIFALLLITSGKLRRFTAERMR